ncbi:minor capsid protein [Cytobacillus sp. FJAT-53684]|uniref:Minor capsid protein n=1 Tax=Cytobacillus mangrovibacter TaxID=3299024 RepID=A0ABW6K4U6_9BACI
MRAKEIINHLSLEGFNVYPDANFMPDVDESRLPALFVFGSGGAESSSDLPMEFPTFQIIVKGKSYKKDSNQMDKTEQLAKSLINHLHSINHQEIGSNLVYYVRSMQSNPIPIGLDTFDRPVYSTNFKLKIQPSKGVKK